MRHGSAEYANAGGDPQRNLTRHGVAEAALVGQVFEKIGAPNLVLHSPYVRTTQTAEHLTSSLSTKPVVLRASALRSGSVPEEMLTELQAHSGFETILAIGHMPDVAELSLMVTGREDLPAMFVPATVVALELSRGWGPGGMELSWMETPVTIGSKL